ncbi:hypothetical protein [Streptomyces sp. NPDC002133]|uniref:hypothetical protein n=1 Tax=Streptomyces sp. NPDC002133 TaxID=3154409 RepID=UPI00332AF8C4
MAAQDRPPYAHPVPTRAYTVVERIAQGAPVHAALDVGDPAAWLDFDAEVRFQRPSIRETGAAGTTHRPALALALCHRDGRIRESALVQAAARPDLLPLIVVRTADWAAPVRGRTRRPRGSLTRSIIRAWDKPTNA